MYELLSLTWIRLSVPWQIAAAAGISLLSTLLLTPLARWCAHKTGVVDRPDGARKMQRKPVALLGGVAVLGGLGITVFAAAAAGAMDNSLVAIVLVSTGLSILCAVGVVDDAYNLPPGWKLLAQTGASIPMVIAVHGIGAVSLFGVQIPMGPFGFLVAMAWLVICTNAVNLIDGMDGLCSTVALCIAVGITTIACFSNAGNTAVCAAGLAGAIAGFLIYNLPPARIYLGDAGSMLIGMTLGLLTMRVAQPRGSVTYPLVMIALMAVPLGDVGLAMIRRKLTGCRMFQADRGHIHHRLLDSGVSVLRTLGIIAVICLSTGAIAVAVYATRSDLLGMTALIAVVVTLVSQKLVGHHEWSLAKNYLLGTSQSAGPKQIADFDDSANRRRSCADPADSRRRRRRRSVREAAACRLITSRWQIPTSAVRPTPSHLAVDSARRQDPI